MVSRPRTPLVTEDTKISSDAIRSQAEKAHKADEPKAAMSTPRRRLAAGGHAVTFPEFTRRTLHHFKKAFLHRHMIKDNL